MAKPATPNRLRGSIDLVDLGQGGTRSSWGNAHGKLAEPRLARSAGMRLQPNSGAMAGAKGDMKSLHWLMEAKTTVNATLPIDLGWLVKISGEALALGLKPAIAVSFVLPSGRPRPNSETDWVMMPLSVFKELTDK